MVERSDNSGNTPLLTAVRHNQVQIVQTLVQFNANCFHRNKNGDTCLHVAAQHDSNEVLPTLASFITEEMFEVRNLERMTAFDVAASEHNYSFLRSLEVLKRNMTV